MSGGGFRGRGFGPHGARYSSPQQSSRHDDQRNTPRGRGNYQRNNFSSSSRRDDNWQRSSQPQRYTRWDQASHSQQWGNSRGRSEHFQNSVRYPYQQHNSSYQQRNNRPYGHGRGGNNDGYGYSGSRGSSNFYSPYYPAPFRERNYDQPFEKESEEPAVPLLGSEEERQQKITEAADELKRKLLSNRLNSPIEPNWYDDFNLDTPNKDEDEENVVKAKPELKHGPPELDLTVSELKDIGRVDFDNTVNLSNASDNNYDEAPVEIVDDLGSWNNLSAEPRGDVDEQPAIEDDCIGASETIDELSGTIVDSFDDFQLDNFEIATLKVRDPLTYDESTTTALSDAAYTTDAAVLEPTSVTDTLTRNDSLNNFGDNDVTSDKNETTPDKSEVTDELNDSMQYTVQTSSIQSQSPEHHEFSTDNTTRKLSETIESESSSQSKSKTKSKRKPIDVGQAPLSSPLQSPKLTNDLGHKEDKVDEPSSSTSFAINDFKNDSNKQTNSPINNKPGERQQNKQPAKRSGIYPTTGAEEFHLPAAFDPRRSSNLSLSTMVPEFDPQLPPPMLTHNAHMSSMPMMNPALNMQAPMASFPPPHSSFTPMVPYAAPIPISYPPVISPVEYSSVQLSQVPLPLSLADKTIDNQASNKPDLNGDSNVSVDDLLGDMQKAMEFAEQCLHSNSNDAIEFPTLPNLPELPPLPESEAPTTKKKKKKKKRNKFEPPQNYGPLQNPNLDGNNLIVANEETVITTEIPMEVFTTTTEPIKAITTPITTVAAITSDTTPVTNSQESMTTSKTSITSKAPLTSKSSITTSKASITTTKAPETTTKTSITAPTATTKIPGATTNITTTTTTTTTTGTTKTSITSSTKSSDNKTTDEDVTDDLKRRKVMFNLNSKIKKISNKADDWFGNEPPEEDSKTKLKRLKILLQQESDADIMATTLTTPTIADNDSTGGNFKSKQSYHESDKVNNKSGKSISESNERDHKKSKDKTRSKSDRRESRKTSDKSEISPDKNNKHVLRKNSNDNNYKTSCSNSSSAGQSSTSKPEKVNDHSHNDQHNTQIESSDSKTPHAALSTWKNRVITRFLRMSKNDIQNMINNSSLRKFDIAMQSLVKEKKSSLSLEMRLNEDEKMKNSTYETYENEDFMSQLQAILDPAATIDITNLPTTFVHQLSEVLHLDPLPPDNDELNDKASLRLALNLDNPSTSNSEIDYNAAGVSSGSTSVSESSRFAGANTPANVAHITTAHDVTAKQRKIDSRVSKDTTKNSVNPTNPTLYTIRTRAKRTDVDPTPSGQQHYSNTPSPSQPVSTSSSTSTSKSVPISKSIPTSKSVSISTSKPASTTKSFSSIVPAVTATASIPTASSAISTILTTAPISSSKVTTHHAENFNMNDLDDIFSAGIARAKTVKSQAAVAAQASTVKSVHQSSTERLMPIAEKQPILRRIETPIVERVERQAVELDKIFTAGIAKAKAASLKNAASFANMVDDLHDMREYRTQRESSRESSSNSGGVWKRKVIIDDPDNFRNLTKEEYEARHGEPPYASYYEDEYRDFAAVRARRLAMNGRESIPPSYGVDNSYFNFSPQFGNSQHISNPDESEDDEHSLAGSESSSWSSSSSGNEDNVELDVSKVLRFIKEREKIAKIKSINDEIRDEVNAEIEKKRREKNARHKSHKSRSKKRDKRKKDKKGKRKKLKKKKRRRSHHSSPVTDNPEERPLWLLREDEIKKEPKEDEIFTKELEPPRADSFPKQTVTAAITKTAPPVNVNKNTRAPVSVSAGINVQSSSASTPASMTAVSKNIHTSSISTAVTTRISTSIATSTAKSVSIPIPSPSLTTHKPISTDSPVTSSLTNLSSGVTKPTTSGLIKTALTTTSTTTSPLRVVTTSCTSSNTSSAQSPVTFTKTKAQLKQMPEIVQQNNKSTSSLTSIEQPVVHSTSDNAATSSINSTNVQTPSPASSTSSMSSTCNTTMTTTTTTTTTTTSSLKTRKLDIKAYKERALQRKIKEQETMRRVAENPSQLTQNLLNLPTKKKSVVIENSSQVIPQVKPTVTSEVNVTQPTKVSSSTDIVIKESINPETDTKNAKTLMSQSKKQPVTPEKPAADASKPVISTTPRKLKRKTPLITDNPPYVEPVVSGEVNKFVNIKSEGGKELKLREKVKNRPSKPAAADTQEVVPKKITPAARKKRKSSANLATVIPETTADESMKNNLSECSRKTTQSAGPETIKPYDSDAIESAKSDNTESIEKKNALQPTKVSIDTKTTNKRKKSLINIETDVSSAKQKVEAERKQEKSGEGKINSLNISAVDSCELKINKNPMASFSHYFKPSKHLMKDDLPNLVAAERMEIKDKLTVNAEPQLLITNNDDNNSTVKTDVTYVSEVPSISKSINIESQQPVESTVNLLPLSDKRIEIEISGVKETPNKGKILRENELALGDDKKEEATCSVTSAEVPPMNDQISDIDGKVISTPVEEINQTKEVLTKIDKLGDASQGTVKINTESDQVEDLFGDNLLSNHEPEEDVNFVTSELSNDLSKTEKIEATSSVSTVCSTLTLIGVGSSSLSTENLNTILLNSQESPVKSLNPDETECILRSNAAAVDPMESIGDVTGVTLSEISEDSLSFEKSYSQGSLADVDPLSECANKYDKIDVMSSKEPGGLCISNLSGDVSLADLKEGKLSEKLTDTWNILDNTDELNEEGLGSIGDTDKSFISDLPLDAPSSPATDNCFKEYSSQSVVLHDQVLTADNPRSSFLEDPLVFSTTKDFPTSDGLEFEVLEDTGVMVEPIYENQLADTSSIDAIEDVPSDQPFVEDEEVGGALTLTALDNPCLSSVLETDFVTDQNTAQISIEGSVSPSIADKELIKVIEGTSPERLPSPILQGQSFVEDENDTPAIEEAPVPEVCDEPAKIVETANDQPALDDNLTEIDTETFRSLNNLKNSITSDATVTDDFNSVRDNLVSQLDDDAAASKEDTTTVAEATVETTESIKLIETPATEQIDLKKSLPETSTPSSLPKELPVTKSDKDEDKHSSRKSNSSKSSTPPREHRKHRKHHHERKKPKITIEKVEEAIAENIVKLVPRPTTKDEVMTRMQEIDITIQELMNEKMRLYQMLQTDKWPITQPAAPGPKSSKLRAQAISKNARVIVSRLTDNKIKQVSSETSPLKQDTSPSKPETTSTTSSSATTPKTLKMDDKKSKTADESSVVKSGKKRKHREDKDHAKSKEPRLEVTSETNKKRHHSDASHRKQKKTEPANVVASAANKQREESPRKHVKLSQILKGDVKPKSSKRKSPSPVEAHPKEQPASSRKSRSVSAEKNVQKDLKAKVDREKSPIDDNAKSTHAEKIIPNHIEETPLKSHIITGLKDQSLIYSDDSTWDTFDSAMKHERPTGLMLLEESMKREKAARKNKYIEQKKKQLNKKTLDAPALSEEEEELPLAELMSKKRLQRKKMQQAVKKNVSKASESLKNENTVDANKNVSRVEETSLKNSKDDVPSKTSSISGVEMSTKSSDNYISNEEVFSKVSSSSTAQISTTQSKSLNSNKPLKDHLLEIIDAVAENRIDDLSDSSKKSRKELKQKDSEVEDSVIVADEKETVAITPKNDKIEQTEPKSTCSVNPGPVVDSSRSLPENYDDCDAEESIPEEAEWTTLDSIGFVDEDSQNTASTVRSVVSEQDKNNKGDGASLDTAKEHGTKKVTVNDDKENQQKKLLQDWDELSIISDKDFDNDNCDINKKDDESEEIIDKKTGESTTMKISGEDQSMTTEDLVQKESNKDSAMNKIDDDSLPTRFDETVERPKSTVQELLRSKTPLPTVSQESLLVDDEKDEDNVEGQVEYDKNALPEEKEEDSVQTMDKKYKTVEIRLQRSKSIVKEPLKSKITVKSVLRNPLSSSDEDEIEKEIISSKKHKRVEIEERPKSTVKELERPKSTVKELRSKTPIPRRSLISDNEDDEDEDDVEREIINDKSETVEINERPKSTVKELGKPKSIVKDSLRSKSPMPNNNQKSVLHNEGEDNDDADEDEIVLSKKHKRVEIEERPKSTVKELERPKSTVPEFLRSKTPLPSLHQKSFSDNDEDFNNDDREEEKEEDYDDDEDDIDREIAASRIQKVVEVEVERPKSTVKELLRSKTPMASVNFEEDNEDLEDEIVLNKIHKRVSIEIERPRSTVKELERPKSTVKELLRSKTPIPSIDQKTMSYDSEEDDVEREIENLGEKQKRVEIEERPKSTVREIDRPKSTVKELLRSKTPIKSLDIQKSTVDDEDEEEEEIVQASTKKQKKVEIEERPKSTVRELERPKSTVKELQRSKTPIKSLDALKSIVDNEDEEEEDEIVKALTKKRKKNLERPKSTVKELERPKFTLKDLFRSKTPMPSFDDQNSSFEDDEEENIFELITRKRKRNDKNVERPKSTVRELERPKSTVKELLRPKTPAKSFNDEKSSALGAEDEDEPVTKRRGKFAKNKKMASNRRGSRQSDDSNKISSRSRRVGKSPSSRDVSPPPEIDTAATTIATTALNKKRPTSGGSSSSVNSRKRGAAASPKIQQQLDNSRSNRRGRKRRNNKLNYDPAEMMKCKVTLVDCKRICLRPESHSDFLQQYGVTKINIRKLSTSSSSSASSREEVDRVVEEQPETVCTNDDSKVAEVCNLNKSVLRNEEKNLSDDEKMSDDDKTHSDDDSMEFIRVEETEDTLGSCLNIQDSRGSRLSSMNDFVSSPHENDELPASDFEVINDDDDDHEASDIEVLEKEIPVPSNTIQPSPSSSSSVPEEKESSSEPRRTQYTVHKGPILDIKVFGDSFLAASEDGAIYRYSQRSNGILNIYKGHEAAVTCLYVHEVPVPGSTNKRWNLFSGSLDATLRCYDIMSGTLDRNVAQVGSPVQCMDEAWGSIFIGTKSGHISRYDIKSGCLREEKLDFSDKPVLALRASTEGIRKVLIVASRNQPITIRDAQNGLFLRTISGQRNHTVYSLLRDRNLVYCGTSNTSIPVFDFISGEQVMQFTAGVGIVCMRLYKQLLFAGCYDGNIYVFDTKEPKLLCSIPGPGNMLLSMEIVDDEIIAGSKDRRLHAWQMPEQIRVIISERT